MWLTFLYNAFGNTSMKTKIYTYLICHVALVNFVKLFGENKIENDKTFVQVIACHSLTSLISYIDDSYKDNKVKKKKKKKKKKKYILFLLDVQIYDHQLRLFKVRDWST